MELKITIFSFSLASVALLTPNEQGQILCASLLGATLGGYMGSFYFQGVSRDGHLTFKKRWAANVATGTCLGPFLASHGISTFPNTPPIFLSLAASGIVGGVGVLLLTIIFPPIISWIKNRIMNSRTD